MEYFDLWDSCMIKSLRLPKSGNQLRFLIQQVPAGHTSNVLSIPRNFSALMFSSLIALVWASRIYDGMKNYQYWLLVAPSGWSFGFAVPSQMTYLVLSITLDSARTYVIQGAFLIQRTVSSIPTVFIVLVIVDMIIGIVVVVVGAPSIIKLVFMITGWAYAFHQDKASSVRVQVANVTLFFSTQLLSLSWSDVPIEIVSIFHGCF
nr:hypothetical protein [Tanacetum cinerariifolium]